MTTGETFFIEWEGHKLKGRVCF